MVLVMEKILLSRIDIENSHKLEVYEAHGGYQAIRKVLGKISPEDLIGIVKQSGLRGRGGAGFPTGLKWSFIPKESERPKYLCCNADEGEPGTFKDRVLMGKDPHMLIEGIILCSYAIGIELSFIYIRGEFQQEADTLDAAVAEARQRGYLGKNILGSGFNHEVIVQRGAGAYVCGEETALIESIEGHRGNPRLKPPFPALVGVFNSPTVINNVETLSALPFIALNGADAYRAFGTEKSTGTKLFSISGNIQKPGVYELPLGTPLKNLIYDTAGGLMPGRRLKGVIPGGSSSPILLPDEIENLALDYESIAAAGSMLGSGAVIVIDDRWSIPKIAWRLAAFYAHESCGQCTPCREGTAWTRDIFKRICNGGGEPQDLDLIADIQDNIMGKTLCPLGDASAMPARTFVKKFRDEFLSLMNNN